MTMVLCSVCGDAPATTEWASADVCQDCADRLERIYVKAKVTHSEWAASRGFGAPTDGSIGPRDTQEQDR